MARSRPALHDQVVAALASARLTGWDELVSDQRAFLDSFWKEADVIVEGDAEVQQAVRFGLFHVVQPGARAEHRPIPAKRSPSSSHCCFTSRTSTCSRAGREAKPISSCLASASRCVHA
ncbi:MAG: hypothetical protein ACT4PI_03300 [Actinomycetota bacterium]